MTHRHNQQTPEADRCRGVDRSLLEFLKPKAEERYSKLEAYCDLLSKASSGAYQSPGTDGALQLLPGQFVATISELARQWQWQRATVRQFISRLIKLGQLSVEPYSKSFIFSVNGATFVSSYRESGRHPRLLRHAVHPLHQGQIHRQGSGRFLQPLLRLEDEHGQAGRIWRYSCQACTQPASPGVRFTGSFHPPLSQSGERTA